jgi:hypothetical protein
MPKRLVRFGGRFRSDELERGEIDLELPEPNPNPPPEDERAEPWALDAGSTEPKHHRLRDRLEHYWRHTSGNN